ncbi:hypothetical protein C5167_000533 [Papaver somniferum]|uniref:Uncharacterized protein n=1 Tax=Papaver somniferum TaxID=3469 RepID=A0A4Y7KTW5_PAPSO|nr:hypothetical protein C5167_000533 [Papaver somniferum]
MVEMNAQYRIYDCSSVKPFDVYFRQAITASEKLDFKTTSNPDSVLSLLRTYGSTELHISKLINNYPFILSSDPHKTLKPKFDFFQF